MSTCNYCHKSGLFLKLEKNGCCEKCAKTIKESIRQIEHDIEINLIYLSNPASTEDRDRTLSDLQSNYEKLIEYKSLCFTGKITNPEIAYQIIEENHDKYYVHLAKQDGDILIEELNKMQRKQYQYKKVEKFLTDLMFEYTGMNDKSKLDPIRKKFEKLRDKYSE
jgi:hypothetical protein